MKTLYLFRSSYDADYILSSLERKNLLEAVILETGKKARIQKLKRFFRNADILKYPVLLLNLLALFIYSSLMENGVKHKVKVSGYRKKTVKLIIDDANDEACIQFIRQYRPDIVFIYGTAILKKNFLSNVGATIVNIHSGIVPYYRNVHSDFWAYLKGDIKNVGVSLFLLDAGIDTGAILLQKHIRVTPETTLIDIKVKNLKAIPQLVELCINKYSAGTLTGTSQLQSDAGFYPTPTAGDMLRLFKKIFIGK